MSRYVIALLLASLSATQSLAQTPGSSPQVPETPDVLVQSVSGCVSRSETGDHFTLSDVKNGAYELVGADVRKYVGKRVEAKGMSRRLQIVGGLWPTPNVAAQAGAIDPLQAMTAAMPGGPSHGTGPEPLLELRVQKIRTVKGRCP
jgi:hypothetical protein